MGEKLDKAKGKAKTVAGAATGNGRLEAEGHLDQAKGKAKNALKDAKKSVKKKTRYLIRSARALRWRAAATPSVPPHLVFAGRLMKSAAA